MVAADNVDVHVSKVDKYIYIGNGQVKRMFGCQLKDYDLAERVKLSEQLRNSNKRNKCLVK